MHHPTPRSGFQRCYPQLMGLLLLLSVPLIALMLGWQWQPHAIPPSYAYLFYGVSQSIPVVSVVLIVLALYRLRILAHTPIRQSLFLLALISATLLLGAGIKTGAKNLLQEPRPYAVWVADQAHISAAAFYALPNKKSFIREIDLSNTAVPRWQQDYWASNTGYSFPSGHGLFVAQLFLLMVSLLWQKKAYRSNSDTLFGYTLLAFSALWAMAVLCSRLVLGMHWPMDLVTSILAAALINAVCLLAYKKLLPSAPIS